MFGEIYISILFKHVTFVCFLIDFCSLLIDGMNKFNVFNNL